MISRRTEQLIYSALFIALGFVFPILFHIIGLGKIFLPMFWPLAVSGFFLTLPFAFTVGLLTPVISLMFTGMPPVPILQLMMIELTVLVLMIRLLTTKTSLGAFWIVLSGLLISRFFTWIVAGWIAPLLGLPSTLFSITKIIEGIPGMLAILIVVPLLVTRIQHIPLFHSRQTHV
ncbi:hypothetical protein ACFL4L_01515 [bacterium]